MTGAPARLRLDGRVALVFGAGSSGPGWGNGRAASVLFAREGARVACVDVSADAAADTQAIIVGEGGVAIALTADVADGAQVAGTVAATLARFGRIDVLHNNVGITGLGAAGEDPLDVEEAAWRRVIDTNLTGAFLACKHAVPAMRAQGKGAIVNVSSLAGERINAYPYFAYYASKSALNHLTRALAVHCAPHGIRANAVMPGVMDTPLIQTQIVGQYADRAAMMAARHRMVPLGRMGDAWDVARAALFLASDEAAYITGVCLPVDGGLGCVSR